MKLKTLLPILVAVPAVGYTMVYAYVWLQTKRDLDSLARQIAPIAELRYSGVGVSPMGTISVHNVVLAPRDSGDQIRIDRVQLKTPGIDFLINSSKSLREGKLPERLGLAFTGIRIDPNGPLWQSIANPKAGEQPSPQNGLACNISQIATRTGGVEALTPKGIVMDLEELLEPGSDPGTASIHVTMRERGFADLSMELKLANLPERLSTIAAVPALSSITARVFFDPEYTRKALKLCAEQSRLTEDQLLPRLLAQDDAAYVEDIGMVPGLGIRDLIRGLLTGKTVEVYIEMPAGLDPSSIPRYRPVDVPRLLNMRVTLNGSPVTDLGFKTGPKTTPVAARPTTNATAPSPTAGAPSTRPAMPADLSFADLARCLDCPVLITLRDGRERRGTVDGVANGIVYLKSQLQQGSMTMEIREGDTAKIRLLGGRGKN